MTWNEYTSHIRALINDVGMRGLLVGEVSVKFRRKKGKGNIFTEVPHFSAPFITLENVLRIIEVNFYQKVKRENLVGKMIKLIV